MATAKKLYKIASDYEQIVGRIIEQGGELMPEDERALEDIKGEWSHKMEAIAKAIRNETAEAQKFATEAKAFQVAAKARSNAAKGLKSYALQVAVALNKSKTMAGMFDVSVQRSPARIVDVEKNDVGMEYCHTEKVIHNKEALEAWMKTEEYREVLEAHKNLTLLEQDEMEYTSTRFPGFMFAIGQHLRIRVSAK